MFSKINDKKYWHLTIAEVADYLKTNTETGLTEDEAQKRLSFFGENTIKQAKSNSSFKIFLSQLKSPLILILIAAGIITLATGHYLDSAFVFVTVLLNSLLGFYQENKADKTLTELKKYIRQRSRVIRGGYEREIDAHNLVPGDIIRLSQGDRVSVDARIIFASDFQVDEAVLTGESLPITKSEYANPESTRLADQTSMVFAGTLVVQGVCTAIVCQTGMRTELGKIAMMVSSPEPERTPLQKSIARLSINLSILVAALVIVVFLIGIFSGQQSIDMFMTLVAIAVSAIPEGLPVTMTVILSVGVERMAKRNGVVRKLIAAEALGRVTVVLTDKTGTLTTSKMVLSKIIPFSSTEDKVLSDALANADVLVENPQDNPEQWRIDGNIMEAALVRAAALRGINFEQVKNRKNIIQKMPFNAIQKFSISLIKQGNKNILIFFGAPDILLPHAQLDTKIKQEILNKIDSFASSGERVLGVATKEVEPADNFSIFKNFSPEQISFDGLITFRDPVRPDVGKSIKSVGEAGVKTVIVTGDHKGTAVAVANEIDMNTQNASVLDASELVKLDDKALGALLPQLSVVSRVTPSDKLRILKAYQANGDIVAMTGDGVNDAPSIKMADVGIAMGSGTEVAQSVADIVLLDDNFLTIVAAIEEGRRILSNIRKAITYLLSDIADELILIGGSLALGIPLPINALQILWVNFFSDSFPAISFAFEKGDSSVAHHPITKNEPLFNPLMKFLILIIGVLSSILVLVIYYFLLRDGYDPAYVKTFIFAIFGVDTLLVALPVRSFDKSIFRYPFFSNKYLLGGVIAGLLLMIAAIYLPFLQNIFGTVPLEWPWVIGVAIISIFNIALIECTKWIFKKRSH